MAHASCPVFGPSVLVEACRNRGLRAKVLYANILLAARAGLQEYNSGARCFNEALVGESLFRSAAFPDHFPAEDAAAFVAQQVAESESPLSTDNLPGSFFRTGTPTEGDCLKSCADQVPAFLDECVATILEYQPKIVGFSSMFQQTLASLAIARRLKAERPEIVTVIGGHNVTSPMGEALTRVTDVFDHVFSGEADLSFPAFCEDLVLNGRRPDERVIQCLAVQDMDLVAVPDYDDYYQQMDPLLESASKAGQDLPQWIYFETARGCWWGERRPCTFCALNLRMAHRHKSVARVLSDLNHLVTKYQARRFQITDNLAPRTIRKELASAIAATGGDYEMFWEIRPDIRPSELDLFFAAGITNLQPGIESFSGHVIKLLNKGTSGIWNLAFLRNCTSRGLTASWNLLVTVPGETRADYEAFTRLIPKIAHLQPPESWGPIRFDRSSPYHSRPEDWGISDVEPYPAYGRLYPPGSPINDLAFHFRATYTTELLDDPDLLLRFTEAFWTWLKQWREQEQAPRLTAVNMAEGLELFHDTRACAVEEFFVGTAELSELLLRLDKPIFTAKVEQSEHLAELLQRHFVIEHEGYYLSVVTRPAIAANLRHHKAQAGKAPATA